MMRHRTRIVFLLGIFTLMAAHCGGQEVPVNHGKLDERLGWLIGEWTAEKVAIADQTQKASAKYAWTAKDQVIRMELTIGDWQGLSIIFWDTSDDTIKMWGANSAGGNGQASMRVEGDELIWTNTVYDKDGKKSVSEFSYIKQDSKTFIVKYTDEATGEVRRAVNKKR